MGPSPTQDHPPNTPRSPLKQPSLSSDDTLKEHNLSHLDVEYLKLQTALIRNRTQRNTLVSVGRLPPEILARIFSIRAMMDPSRISGAQRLGWIAVTHVCGHWRRVALACSSLWTKIRFDIGDKWTQKMFVRARKAPLRLLHLFPPLSDHQLGLIARHIHSGQEIVLNSSLSSLFPALTSRPFPHLTAITITFSEHHGEPYVMPHDFLGSYAPQLRRLDLKRTQVNWTAPVLSGLVELNITYSLHTQPRSACADFLDALRSMSRLENLELEDLPLQTHEPEHIIDIVTMPSLAFLSISDSMLQTVHLLNHLSLAPSAEIELYFHPSSSTSTAPPPSSHFRQFFASITSCIQCARTPIWSLSLGSYYPWEFTVVATRGSADLYGRISITIDWGRRDAFDMVAAMCEGFGKNLDVLHVEMEEFTWSVAAWWSIIQAASNVRVLSVAGFAADVFCATLAIASSEPPPGSEAEIQGVPQQTLEHQYLPKLVELCLVRAQLLDETTRVLASLEEDHRWIGVNCYKQYAKWIRRREEAGIPLQTLQLEQCDMSDETRALLEGVCGTVVIT